MTKYSEYLKDQVEDSASGGQEVAYLEYLPTLLPEVTFDEMEILDIGSGVFSAYEFLTSRFSPRLAVAVDVCKESIDQAEALGRPVLEFDAHDLGNLFSPESFDWVLSFHSFEHMFDLPLVLHNAFQVLRPGGYLFCALPIPSYNWGRGHWYNVPNVSDMENLLEEAGFSLCHSELVRDLRFRPEQEGVFLATKE